MNNTGKRFNIIDFVIIVIVLGCIFGLILRYDVVNRFVSDEQITVKLSFVSKALNTDVANSVEAGDVFYSVSTNNTFGKLESCEVKNSEFIYSDAKGKPIVGTDPTLKDIKGSFTVKGVMTGNGFMLGSSQFIAPGKNMIIQSQNVQLSVIITEINAD